MKLLDFSREEETERPSVTPRKKLLSIAELERGSEDGVNRLAVCGYS